jgi:hypothetical protein
MKNSEATLKKKREKIAEWKRSIDRDSVPKYITRTCKECGEDRPCRWMSTFSEGSGKPQYRSRCDECHNKYLQRNRKKPGYKAWRNAARRRSIDKRKKMAVDLLGGKCEICGYSKCIAALTFHHKSGEVKDSDVSKMYDRPLSEFLSEVNKCNILCQNCHMELHWSEGRDSNVQAA